MIVLAWNHEADDEGRFHISCWTQIRFLELILGCTALTGLVWG